MEYYKVLKKVETAASVITDEALKKIAFDRLLEHELRSANAADDDDIPEIVPSRPKGKQGIRPSRKGQSFSAVRDELKQLSVSPDMPGLPPWNSLAVSDKYLWILEAAKSAGVDGLTGTEISFLIFQTFRETHRSNQISNLKKKIPFGFVQFSNGSGSNSAVNTWRILPKGTLHLQSLTSGESSSL